MARFRFPAAPKPLVRTIAGVVTPQCAQRNAKNRSSGPVAHFTEFLEASQNQIIAAV